ncbi:MAG: NUDIX domain-containing protein [Anaerolineae bacterium]|nr:NUDIX domain-containing protein [Anaerolineae bacterium]
MGASEQGASATEGRWLVIPRTLSFVRSGEGVLLMKRGAHKRIFPNRYNGLGGHIERDEDVEASARREIEEESGLTVRDLRLRGIHQIDTGEATGILLFIYTAWSDGRAVVNSAEGTLEWVHPRDLPGLDLVEDVAEILARLLKTDEDAPPWYAHVSYDANDQIVLRFVGQAQAGGA